MERSSGGIIRYHDTFLVLQYGLGHWGWVKGHLEPGETPHQAFLREAAEEAGLQPTDLRLIPGFQETIHYFYKKDYQTVYKEVLYFLADALTDKVTISPEHIAYAWLSYSEALIRVTFAQDKMILEKANEFLQTHK